MARPQKHAKKARVLKRMGIFLGMMSALLLLHSYLGEWVLVTATGAATLFHISGFIDDLFA
jgi:UDP-N-acetylmuramyl pentapeptide phosphotransferase/UDP-N-acetylglucosamine-1-phosphate transferase